MPRTLGHNQMRTIPKLKGDTPDVRKAVLPAVRDYLANVCHVRADKAVHGAMNCPVCHSRGSLGFYRSEFGVIEACCKKPGCVAISG